MRAARCLALLAVLLFPCWARAQLSGPKEAVPPAPPATAFELDAYLIALVGPGFSATLVFGARLFDRLQLGLGVGFFHTSAQTMAGKSEENIVTLAPGARVDLVRSKERAVALYAAVSVPLGPAIVCPPGAPCDVGLAVGVDGGLGVRLALHRMFALSLEGGVSADFTNPQRPTASNTAGVYGAAVGSFYYGK